MVNRRVLVVQSASAVLASVAVTAVDILLARRLRLPVGYIHIFLQYDYRRQFVVTAGGLDGVEIVVVVWLVCLLGKQEPHGFHPVNDV
jgi:ABC-type tungstate transport system substrate-binding protein